MKRERERTEKEGKATYHLGTALKTKSKAWNEKKKVFFLSTVPIFSMAEGGGPDPRPFSSCYL